MFRRVHGRGLTVVWATALTAAIGFSAEHDTREKTAIDLETAAQQLVADLLEPKASNHRPPLTTDAEQAHSIDPVLTGQAPVWIHEARPAPPLTVIGGRVFTYRDVPYDPLEAPVLKIRPMDGDRRTPFLIRVVFRPDGVVPPQATLDVTFPAPPIFNPRVAHVTAWVGRDQVKASIESSVAAATILIRVPLEAATIEPVDGLEQLITVIVEGELVLGSYRTQSPGRFRNVKDNPYDPAIGRLSELETGRDVINANELQQILEVANTVASETTTDYQRVVAINSWVADSLQYRKSPATRTPLEALEDRSGDCDDHTALMVAMLRAKGIAARRATGLLYNLDSLSAHSWVEVALPTRDSDLQWFIVDPTLAGTTPIEAERSSFVQFKDRILLYPVRPTVGVVGLSGDRTTDALLNWRMGEKTRPTTATQLDELIDLVVDGVGLEISRKAKDLVERALLLRRQSTTIAGSPYVLIDRATAEKTESRLQLRLENEERLVLELTASIGEALEDKTDLETIDHLKRAYSDLNGLFFGGAPAHWNLELVFDRDRHTDRLHTVSLRIGRYLLEHHLDRILKRLSKNHLLTEEEVDRFSEVAGASGGKNLYVLQELARRHRP